MKKILFIHRYGKYWKYSVYLVEDKIAEKALELSRQKMWDLAYKIVAQNDVATDQQKTKNLADLSHAFHVEKRWKEPEGLRKYKHLFSHFLEYLFIYWLRTDLGWIMTGKVTNEKELQFGQFPNSLENNVFLSFFNTLKPKDIFESSLCQVLSYTSRRLQVRLCFSSTPSKPHS